MYFSALAFSDQREHLRELAAARQGAGRNAPLRILLPYDGSEAAEHAVRYAARSLPGMGPEVLLVNAQQPVLDDPALLHAANALVAAHQAEGDRVLKPARAILEAAGVEFSTEVAFGPPADVIASTAQARDCTLILMGTRARHPLVNLVTRSVPSKVVRRSHVPVMLVRHGAEARLTLPARPGAPFIAA